MLQQKIPSLPELLGRYLERQADAHASGLGQCASLSEVEPYDAVPVQPVDADQAWREGLRVLEWYGATQVRSVGKPHPDWATLVAGLEPLAAVPFCLGNYPQLVRDFHVLATATGLTTLMAAASSSAPTLGNREQEAREIAAQPFAQRLASAGVLRLARCFEACEQRLMELSSDPASKAWQSALANERAALAWHRGRSEEAAELWARLESSVPVLFNRGMANLFLGRIEKATPPLGEAVALLPETDAWHHLGRLYLTLAEMR